MKIKYIPIFELSNFALTSKGNSESTNQDNWKNNDIKFLNILPILNSNINFFNSERRQN